MKVKCIDDGGSHRLIVNKIYDVLKEDRECYWIKDEQEDAGWFKTRFEIVSSDGTTITSNNKIKIKCITNSCGAEGSLIVDKTYEVIRESGDNWIIVDENKRELGWLKSRFEIVENIPIVNSSKQTSSSDPEEDRCWALMQPYVVPGNCKCDMPKKDCPYHKDL